MISRKINNIHMRVILLLCKKTHYLLHNNWLLFWGMSLISVVLFRLLILICMTLLRKNLTSADILWKKQKILHLINHSYSQSDNFNFKNGSPLNNFKIKNHGHVLELKKKKYCHKREKCYTNRKIKLALFKLTLWLLQIHFLLFTGFRKIRWVFKIRHRTIYCPSPKWINLLRNLLNS